MFWSQKKTKMMPQNMTASKTTFTWNFIIRVVRTWVLMLWRFILSLLRSSGRASQIFSRTWNNVTSVVINWYKESIWKLTLLEQILDLAAINVGNTLHRKFLLERTLIMYMAVFISSATIVHSRGTLKEIYWRIIYGCKVALMWVLWWWACKENRHCKAH